MELAKQVTNLEISKKLSDLWFCKDSHWEWIEFCEMMTLKECVEIYEVWRKCKEEWDKSYPAYTASELMEYLKEWVKEKAEIWENSRREALIWKSYIESGGKEWNLWQICLSLDVERLW